MESMLKAVTPLAGYRLELTFRNGSTAVVNMERRVKTLRFARLASPQVFASVKADGDKVVWQDGGTSFGVYCNELLDAMLME